MNAKKWTSYTIILGVFIFSIVYFFRIAAQNYFFDMERIIWTTKTNLTNSINPNNYDYIIVGSSKTLALNPEYISKKTDLKGINLSVGGATILYHYYTIKRLIDRNQTLPKIFINLVPNQFDHNSMENTYFYNQKLCRWFIDDDEAQEVNKYISSFYNDCQIIKDNKFIMYSDLSLLRSLYTDIRYYRRYGDTATDLLKYELNNNKGFYLFGEEPVFSHKVKYAHNTFLNTNKSLSKNGIHSSSKIYFNKLLKLLKENNINYTFFFSPFYTEQSEYVDLDFGESMYLFNQIDNKNIIKNVLLLGGINFTDSQHLNYKGSAIYNDWFVENIKHNKPTNFTEYKLQ